MKYVLLVFQGTTPLPGTDRWKALPDYAALNDTPGMTPGLPLGLPGAARTVQVQGGKVQVKDGLTSARASVDSPYTRRRAWGRR